MMLPTETAISPIVCISLTPAAVTADILAVPWFEGEDASAVGGLDAATSAEVSRALTSQAFQAKTFELFSTPIADRRWQARRVMLIGAGTRNDSGGDLIRKQATTIGLAARQFRFSCEDKASSRCWRRPPPKG